MIAQRTTNLNLSRRRSCSFCGVIPEIDIWRAAQLMLKRYGDQAALKESAARADELAVAGDQNGAVTRRRITDAVLQLANKTRPDRCTDRCFWLLSLPPRRAPADGIVLGQKMIAAILLALVAANK
jgi:hypothetical protein